MSKIVLAGQSDCPYYARCERLGDRLAKNLQKFKLHKIVIQPDQWKEWLQNTCAERGWTFSKSPIVWRELIDRGGKGVLIGGANDFQEYAKAYYNIEVEMDSTDMKIIAEENRVTKNEIDTEIRECKARTQPAYICITNAADLTCYYLLNSLTLYPIFGQGTLLQIRLLVTSMSDVQKTSAYLMEVEDLGHGCLSSINIYSNAKEAFQDCCLIIMLDSLHKLPSESHASWLERNAELFKKYALFINEHALKTCKILLCGNGPLNFNAMIMIKNMPSICRQNIVALSTIIENQAKSVVGEKLDVYPADIVNLIVWGNLDNKYVLDLTCSRTYRHKGAITAPSWFSVSTLEALHDCSFVETELPKLVKKRHKKAVDAIGYQTNLSIAAAIATTVQYWLSESPKDQIFSLAVCSEGWFEVPKGLVFSFPVKLTHKGTWTIVQDVNVTRSIKNHLHTAIKVLMAQIAPYRSDLIHTDSALTTKVGGTIFSFISAKESLPDVD